MQNQRSTVVGQLLYKNSIDCARKIFRNEGFVGFYRGLGPQLVGVVPEKAIKLTVNDIIRARAMDPETGRIKLIWELVAGGSAGASQVVRSTLFREYQGFFIQISGRSLQIRWRLCGYLFADLWKKFSKKLWDRKIRLQVQGETAKVEGAKPKGAIHIIRQLGVLGLYRGSSACLLRDIPFSAIYFTAYFHLKTDVFQEGYNGKRLSFLETLGAAAIACGNHSFCRARPFCSYVVLGVCQPHTLPLLQVVS